MSATRYPENFKTEAIKQVTNPRYKVTEVVQRFGVTVKSMHEWINKYDSHSSQHRTLSSVWDEQGVTAPKDRGTRYPKGGRCVFCRGVKESTR